MAISDIDLFQWDPEFTSSRLEINETEPNVVRVINQNGFKTSVGDQPILPLENSFFMIKIRKGAYVKLGICRKEFITDLDQAFCD